MILSRRGPKRSAAIIVALCLIILGGGLLLDARVARAHGRFVEAQPPPGAILAESPAQLTIRFSEQIAPRFSRIQVASPAGQQVQQGSATQPPGDPATLRVGLAPALASGVYLVNWRIVSAVDGHLTQGSFAFAVARAGEPVPRFDVLPGAPAAGESEGAASGATPPASPIRWFLRGVMLFNMAVLLGGSLFTALILDGRRGLVAAASRRFARLAMMLALLLALVLAGDIAFQLADVLAVPAGAPSEAAWQFLSGTDFGRYWLGKAACALLLALIFAVLATRRSMPPPSAGVWNLAVALGASLVAAQALSSHAAAIPAVGGVPIGLIADALHLVTAAAWVGGLCYLGAVLLPVLHWPAIEREERLQVLGRLVPRFSKIALGSVILLSATGGLNLALHTLEPEAVTRSSYGVVLIAKHLLFLPMLVLGAFNNRRLAPRFVRLLAGGAAAADETSSTLFSRLVAAEVVIAAGVLLCAAGLTLLPPPVGSPTTAAAPARTRLIAPVISPTPSPVSLASPGERAREADREHKPLRYSLETAPLPISHRHMSACRTMGGGSAARLALS